MDYCYIIIHYNKFREEFPYNRLQLDHFLIKKHSARNSLLWITVILLSIKGNSAQNFHIIDHN